MEPGGWFGPNWGLEEIYNPDYCEGSVLSMMVSLPQIQKTKGHILPRLLHQQAVDERLR